MEIKYDKIVSLGAGCDVLFALEKLDLMHKRGKTGIFDWVSIIQIKDITLLIETKFKDITVEYRRGSEHKNGNYTLHLDQEMCHITGTDICTGHYDLNNYKCIVQRRSERFLEDLRSNNSILFIREDCLGFSSSESDILRLTSAILSINPHLKFKIAVIHQLENAADFVPYETEYAKNYFFLTSQLPKNGRWTETDVVCWHPILSDS